MLSFFTCLSCAANEANAVTVLGRHTCGEWVLHHQADSNSVEGVSEEGWLPGYLSGFAFASNKNFLSGADPLSLLLWVSNYCRDNPIDYLADAAAALAYELIKRKGL